MQSRLARKMKTDQQGLPPYLSQRIEINLEQGKAQEARARRLAQHLRFQQTEGGMSSLLRQNDRSSMAWSVESRVPFLNRATSEFALGLPENQLVSTRGETKHILRSAMHGILPDDLINRRDKIGFGTPGEVWLREIGDDMITYVDGLRALGFINVNYARNYVRDALSSHKPLDSQVWRLINLGRWCDLVL